MSAICEKLLHFTREERVTDTTERVREHTLLRFVDFENKIFLLCVLTECDSQVY